MNNQGNNPSVEVAEEGVQSPSDSGSHELKKGHTSFSETGGKAVRVDTDTWVVGRQAVVWERLCLVALIFLMKEEKERIDDRGLRNIIVASIQSVFMWYMSCRQAGSGLREALLGSFDLLDEGGEGEDWWQGLEEHHSGLYSVSLHVLKWEGDLWISPHLLLSWTVKERDSENSFCESLRVGTKVNSERHMNLLIFKVMEHHN